MLGVKTVDDMREGRGFLGSLDGAVGRDGRTIRDKPQLSVRARNLGLLASHLS
jgi:hypothetical protein